MCTIRAKILPAFLAFGITSIPLGLLAVRDPRRDGVRVEQTFDKSLMSVDYARATSADVNAIQAVSTRYLSVRDETMRTELRKRIATMDDDLAIAVERAQSQRAETAARHVTTAVAA